MTFTKYGFKSAQLLHLEPPSWGVFSSPGSVAVGRELGDTPATRRIILVNILFIYLYICIMDPIRSMAWAWEGVITPQPESLL
jgi:hypothetical protein